MAVYTDNFTGTVGDLTSPWVQGRTSAGLTMQRDGSGAARSQNNLGNDCIVAYNNTIGADQYSQITAKWAGTGTATNYIYIILRAPASAAWWEGASNAFYVFWSDGGSDTQILYTTTGHLGLTMLSTDNTLTFTTNDIIKFQVVGNQLKLFKNGTENTTLRVTDAGSHVSTGFPGFGLAVDSITKLMDDFEGGDVSAISAVVVDRPRGSQRPFPFLPGSPSPR